MTIRRVKEVVSRKGILREIEKTRKRLAALEKRAALGQRDAILRQKLQLDLCEAILFDIHIIDP